MDARRCRAGSHSPLPLAGAFSPRGYASAAPFVVGGQSKAVGAGRVEARPSSFTQAAKRCLGRRLHEHERLESCGGRSLEFRQVIVSACLGVSTQEVRRSRKLRISVAKECHQAGPRHDEASPEPLSPEGRRSSPPRRRHRGTRPAGARLLRRCRSGVHSLPTVRAVRGPRIVGDASRKIPEYERPAFCDLAVGDALVRLPTVDC
jgi:hypothetical protein